MFSSDRRLGVQQLQGGVRRGVRAPGPNPEGRQRSQRYGEAGQGIHSGQIIGMKNFYQLEKK